MSFAVAEKSAQVDALFASWPGGMAPGVAVVIVQDGEVLHRGSYGLANLETGTAISSNTSFRLASITKQFTAMAVMMLCERGALEYDDPVSRFLPEFSTQVREITIRHLLWHTSGLQDYEELFWESGEIVEDYPRASKQKQNGFEPASKDALKIMARHGLRFAPGDEWEYVNSGYVALAQIVERVSGKSFSQFLKERIFVPLGMNDSLLYDEARPEIPGRAISYTVEGEIYREVDYTPLNLIYGQDGIYSTADDMVKWYRALASDKLVAPSTLKKAFTSGKLNIGAKTGYGFGWFVGTSLGLSKVAHTGSWVGFRTFVVYYPEQKLAALVLCNFDQFDGAVRSAIACKLAKIYLSDKMSLPVAVNVEPQILRQYVGEYELERDCILNVTLEDDALWVKPSDLFPIKLVPESKVKFFVDEAESDSYFFHKDYEGNIKSLTRHLSLFGYSRDAYGVARKVS
jgi:CubicO group peptidase (beta-lactamase class C family)